MKTFPVERLIVQFALRRPAASVTFAVKFRASTFLGALELKERAVKGEVVSSVMFHAELFVEFPVPSAAETLRKYVPSAAMVVVKFWSGVLKEGPLKCTV